MESPAVPPPLSRRRLTRLLGGVLENERDSRAADVSVGRPSLRARVLATDQLVFSEELYLKRQILRQQFSRPRPWFFVVLRGGLVFDPGGQELNDPVLLSASRNNFFITSAGVHEITVSQPPLSLLRIGFSGQRGWRPSQHAGAHPFPLLRPMFLLAAQAAEPTRERLLHALQSYCESELVGFGCELTSPFDDPLEDLAGWLKFRLSRPLSLSDMAAACHLSPRRLQELCRSRYGHTPMELLRHLRLEALRDDLSDPAERHVSIPALYRRWQLSDSLATQQAFKARYGLSPSSFRRAHQQSAVS